MGATDKRSNYYRSILLTNPQERKRGMPTCPCSHINQVMRGTPDVNMDIRISLLSKDLSLFQIKFSNPSWQEPTPHGVCNIAVPVQCQCNPFPCAWSFKVLPVWSIYFRIIKYSNSPTWPFLVNLTNSSCPMWVKSIDSYRESKFNTSFTENSL